MHEAISASKAIQADAGPACEGVFANFVVLDFESGGGLVGGMIRLYSEWKMRKAYGAQYEGKLFFGLSWEASQRKFQNTEI